MRFLLRAWISTSEEDERVYEKSGATFRETIEFEFRQAASIALSTPVDVTIIAEYSGSHVFWILFSAFEHGVTALHGAELVGSTARLLEVLLADILRTRRPRTYGPEPHIEVDAFEQPSRSFRPADSQGSAPRSRDAGPQLGTTARAVAVAIVFLLTLAGGFLLSRLTENDGQEASRSQDLGRIENDLSGLRDEVRSANGRIDTIILSLLGNRSSTDTTNKPGPPPTSPR